MRITAVTVGEPLYETPTYYCMACVALWPRCNRGMALFAIRLFAVAFIREPPAPFGVLIRGGVF
jgi:hypothetical protein